MNVSANDRHRLHVRVEQLLGPDDGAILMELLPSGDWDGAAMQRDLVALGTDLREFKAEMREFQREMRASTRLLFFSILASQATLVGMVIAAIKL